MNLYASMDIFYLHPSDYHSNRSHSPYCYLLYKICSRCLWSLL